VTPTGVWRIFQAVFGNLTGVPARPKLRLGASFKVRLPLTARRTPGIPEGASRPLHTTPAPRRGTQKIGWRFGAGC